MGSAIVIGHNVYHVVPNEVPILFVLGLLSVRVREGSWTAMGLAMADLVAANRSVCTRSSNVKAFARYIGHRSRHSSLLAGHSRAQWLQRNQGSCDGGTRVASADLDLCRFGEEVGYRGYLLRRAADVGGRSKAAYWARSLIVAVLFGYGHYYKGPAGVVDSGMAGLILGAAYVLSGRNLWVCILAHGFIDTVGVVAAFLGWSS